MQLFKRIYGSGIPALIISNGEMEDIMKLLKSLEESKLTTWGISETVTKIEAKEQKGKCLPMLLGTLAASIIGKVLRGKEVIKAGKDTIRADQNFYCSLIL